MSYCLNGDNGQISTLYIQLVLEKFLNKNSTISILKIFQIFLHSVLLVSLKNIVIFAIALTALYLSKKRWIIPATVILSSVVGLMI
ncbi:MAG: hypothetical protein V4694_05470 [Pseudomonadota bacterium]